MKLQKSKIIEYIAMINLQFPNSYKFSTQRDKEIFVDLWFEGLKDYPKEVVDVAVKQVILKAEFVPKISTILAEIKKLTEANKKTDVELWAELEDVLYPVYRASLYLCYEQYHKWASDRIKQIYESLSDEIKLFVVNISTLKELAELANRSDDDSIKFEKARFLKAMPDLRSKQTSRIQVKQFLQLCEAKGINLIEGSDNGS